MVEEVPGRGVSTGERKAGCVRLAATRIVLVYPKAPLGREEKEVLLDSGLLGKAFLWLLNLGPLRVWVLTHSISVFVLLCVLGMG